MLHNLYNTVAYSLQLHRKGFLSLLLSLVFITTGYGQTMVVSDQVNDTTGSASAVLDLKSSTKGFLPPRMTQTQREAIQTPAEGLLVFQTDAPNGLYYYKDSAWVLLTTSADVWGVPVTKTASDTILKTETFIMASGNIQLTLPAITAADNGLTITVKNVGTYTDLVIVTGYNGARLDSVNYVPMPRWFGITMVANNGNWFFKERTMLPANTLNVSSIAPWNTLEQAIAFLDMHMWEAAVIRMESDTFFIPSTINIDLPYPLTIEGSSYGTTTLAASTGLAGTPMFTCATECYFKKLIFDGNSLANYGNSAGEDAIRLTGSGTYHEIKDCGFDHFNKTIVMEDDEELWFFESDISNAVSAGVEIAAGTATGTFLKISEVDFYACQKGLNLVSGVSAYVSVLNCGFYNSGGSSVGINYVPATFTSVNSIYISNNTWNRTGTMLSGFDFTRSDGRDKDISIDNNLGIESQNPHCKVNVLNNATTSTVNSTWAKPTWNGTAQTSYTSKFTIGTNRITYQTSNVRDLIMWLSGNVSLATSNRTVNIAIVKNGNSTLRYGETSVRIVSTAQPFQWSTIAYIPNASPGDYFEVWTNLSTSNTETLTIQDLNWFVNSQ